MEEEERYAALPGKLIPWYRGAARDLPWRQDHEPYHVWLSEIMLQQTRVEAVRGYYTRFLARLPSILALAEADEELVHKLWEGLGYYSRARNLHRAAKLLVEKYGGCFPKDYAQIRALPGVGDYTAGAIASICFDLPCPAVDGNVLRIIARLTALQEPVDTMQVKKLVAQRLALAYPAGACGDFTQSLMELGALICLPNGQPKCTQCPLADLCLARKQGLTEQLPLRTPKRPRRVETRTVLILRCGARWAICRRPSSGLLAGLWELPNLPGELSAQEALQWLSSHGLQPAELLRERERQHIFTHVLWNLRGYDISCRAEGDAFTWVTEQQLKEQYALPTAFRQFLDFL